MPITIIKRGRMPTFNANGVAKAAKSVIPGLILERTNKGIDVNGNQFAPYSRRYIKFLRMGGEDTKVDLRLSGGLLNSVKARQMTITDSRVEVTIAPDTRTSPVWKPKAAGPKRAAKMERSRMKAPYENAGEFAQSPPHDRLGYWLHHGTPKMKARPWMGLTDEQLKDFMREIASIAFR